MSLWCYECKLNWYWWYSPWAASKNHWQTVKDSDYSFADWTAERNRARFSLGWLFLIILTWVWSSQSSLPYTGHLPKVYKCSSSPDGSVSIELIAREYPHILRDMALACVLMCVDLHMRTPRNTSKHTWAMHICNRTHLYLENGPPMKYKDLP